MRQSKRLVGLSAIALFVALVPSNERAYAADSIDRPNILFIAVDDSFWCHSLYDPVGLAITEIELIPPD